MILSLQSIQHVEGQGLEIVFTSSDSNELVNRLKLLHQEQIAGNDPKLINDEIKAIGDKLSEFGCLTNEEQASFNRKDLVEVLNFFIFFYFH